MHFSFGAATAALFLASSLMAQAGTDPNPPVKAAPGQSTTSTSVTPSAATVVLPNAYATKMGNSNNIFGVAWANQRYQQNHAGAEVGNARPFFAHALRFRNASHTGPTQTLEIKLSASDTTPATHSATFATNIGSNKQTTVFKGNYKYPDMVPNTSPTSFKIVIPYKAPWPWTNPAKKGLLFETLNTSAANGSYFVDAASGDTNVSRSWATGVTTATGTVGLNFGLITAILDKPVPPFASYDLFGRSCPGTGGKVGTILPKSQRTKMGNSNNIFGAAYQNQRYHQLMLNDARATVYINHAFRPGTRSDAGPTRALKILMSKSQVAPASISTTFATNIGTNAQTTVFSGTHKYPNMVPSTNPQEFKLSVPWTANFVWTPAKGDNMLYEYQCSDLASGGAFYPNAISGDAETSRLWGTGPTAATGSVGLNYGLCVCFGYKGIGSTPPSLTNVGTPVINTTMSINVGGAQATPGIAVLIMGVSKSTWSNIPLPFDLTVLGAKGCNLYVSFDLTFGVALDKSGNGKSALSIPNAPALYGFTWHNQYFVFDPTANALGLVFTNGGSAKVGGL
ncbi:MAG: hypothetical protein CMJ85_08265 [Planctomycetes bacterium]|nr:hypothetical protein [Planctomycetota bacterium]